MYFKILQAKGFDAWLDGTKQGYSDMDSEDRYRLAVKYYYFRRRWRDRYYNAKGLVRPLESPLLSFSWLSYSHTLPYRDVLAIRSINFKTTHKPLQLVTQQFDFRLVNQGGVAANQVPQVPNHLKPALCCAVMWYWLAKLHLPHTYLMLYIANELRFITIEDKENVRNDSFLCDVWDEKRR
jgi:hypothetical protein